ncbi:MAG: hypothetical protein IJI10_01530 [Eubacterium sp.]|nr:hypothetical protein [Eubacterium sp.]
MRVLFYGDSNTYGFDPRDPFDDRYPAAVRWTDRLAEMLKKSDLAEYDKREPGQEAVSRAESNRTATGQADSSPAETGQADSGQSATGQDNPGRKESCHTTWEVIARGQNGRCVPVMPQMAGYIRNMIREVWPVDRFAVMLGTNDLLQTYRPDAALPAAQMRQFLLFLQKEYPEMERMLIAPPLFFLGLGDGEFFRKSREESIKLTRLYERIAKETGSMFVDAGQWNIDLAADYVHFSETGHAQFAKEIVKYFNT